jgi:hypothetical protein
MRPQDPWAAFADHFGSFTDQYGASAAMAMAFEEYLLWGSAGSGSDDKSDDDDDYPSSEEDTDDMSTEYQNTLTSNEKCSWEFDSMDSRSGTDEEAELPLVEEVVHHFCECESNSYPFQDLCPNCCGKSRTTTLTLCNIPCHITEQELTDTLIMLGFAKAFDFLYVPPRQWGWRRRGNFVNASVNFKSPEYASQFAAVFTNFSFPKCHSEKLSYVKAAECQGYDAITQMHAASKSSQKYFRMKPCEVGGGSDK